MLKMGLESHIKYVIEQQGFHYNSDVYVDNSGKNSRGVVLVVRDKITRNKILEILKESRQFRPIKYMDNKILLLSLRNPFR